MEDGSGVELDVDVGMCVSRKGKSLKKDGETRAGSQLRCPLCWAFHICGLM